MGSQQADQLAAPMEVQARTVMWTMVLAVEWGEAEGWERMWKVEVVRMTP